MHAIGEVQVSAAAHGIGFDGGLQISFSAEGCHERRARKVHQSVVESNGGFADAVHEAIERMMRVCARQTVDAEGHFGRAQPTRVGLLADMEAIVGRFDVGGIAFQMHRCQEILVVRKKAHGRAGRKPDDKEKKRIEGVQKLHGARDYLICKDR